MLCHVPMSRLLSITIDTHERPCLSARVSLSMPSCNLPVTRVGSGMLHYRYRDYRTMCQPGRRTSDPSDPRASQWLTQICGLGQPVALTSKGTPADHTADGLRAAPSDAAARRVDSVPQDAIAREFREKTTFGGVVLWAVTTCSGEAHKTTSYCFSYRSNLASSSNLAEMADSSNEAIHPVDLQRRE